MHENKLLSLTVINGIRTVRLECDLTADMQSLIIEKVKLTQSIASHEPQWVCYQMREEFECMCVCVCMCVSAERERESVRACVRASERSFTEKY